MIELLFVACLTSSPLDCHEEAMVFIDVSPLACMMGAQPQLAQWTTTHPEYQVESWRCQTVDLSKTDV